MEEIQQDTIQLLIVRYAFSYFLHWSDIHRAKSLAAMKRHRDEMLDSFSLLFPSLFTSSSNLSSELWWYDFYRLSLYSVTRRNKLSRKPA